jgi:uncharacterized membrane protein YhaH (DUF805 family)
MAQKDRKDVFDQAVALFVFGGRASRSQFWLSQLVLLVGAPIAQSLVYLISPRRPDKMHVIAAVVESGGLLYLEGSAAALL